MSFQISLQSISEEFLDTALANTETASTSSTGVVAISSNVVVSSRDVPHIGQSPMLPTGQVIDGKNTLQCFNNFQDTPAVFRSSVEPANPDHPTLPDGQIINSKNTLQSFNDRRDTIQRIPIDPPEIPLDEVKISSSDDPPNPILAPNPSSVIAVAVAIETDIVHAELAPEPMSSNIAMDHNMTHDVSLPTILPWYKARSFFVLIIISLLLAGALGLSIGINYGSSSKALKNSNSEFPTSSPILFDSNLYMREAIFTSYINNITLSNQTISANGTSPESKALAWMIANDTTFNTSTLISQDDPISGNAIGFRIRQRYPLLVIWFQQTATANWDNVAEWLVNPNECYWYGISCKALYVAYDDKVNNSGLQNVVTQVKFDLIGSFVGVIPSDIGLLSSMERFEIKNTREMNNENGGYLTGPLPNTIGRWTALTYFDVSKNSLTGTLPVSIGQWTALTSFIAFKNGLTGKFPDSIGQWTDLTYFDVYDNAFNGPLPSSIGQWTALTYFRALRNVLRGTLPDSIGQWTALSHFDVSNSMLIGTLPGSIGQWTALTYLDVSPNNLTGTIPSSIGNWMLIETAFFQANQFVGTIPNVICQYVDQNTDILRVDCTVNCTCCTTDCLNE